MPAMPPRRDLDASALAALERVLPAADAAALRADLVRGLRERLDRIGRARDPLKARQDAHDLRGMGGNFGLEALVDAAAGLERAARAGDAREAALARERTLAAGRRALDALARHASGPGRPRAEHSAFGLS